MTMRESIVNARIGSAQKTADGSATQEFCFPPEDPTFSGHFPTRPILPGIFQLEMARVMAEEVLNCSVTIGEVTKAKFLWPIVPAETIRVELKLIPKDEKIQARAKFFIGGRQAGETILQLIRNS